MSGLQRVCCADLVGNKNAEARCSLLQHLEGVFICSVISQVDGDDVITIIQAQGIQHVSERLAFAPIHLHTPPTSGLLLFYFAVAYTLQRSE